MQESTYRGQDTILKWLTMVAIAIGGVFGLWKYSDSVEKEFRMPYWERQIEYYFNASRSAAAIATTCDITELSRARTEFYQLYFGPLVLVEDRTVEKAMVAFHNELKSNTDGKNCDTDELKNLSLDLSRKLRRSIGETWSLKLEELTDYKEADL